ncbi:MAG: hypothetical protein ACRC8Y_20190 [Chroococcales cyanobacterium]
MSWSGLGWGPLEGDRHLIPPPNISGPLPLARSGLGWGPLEGDRHLIPPPNISGPLPLARGGLGWGPLEGDRHVTADTLHPLIPPDVGLPRQENPTLTRTKTSGRGPEANPPEGCGFL